MHKLYIYRAKPNPLGKGARIDRPQPEQLLGEWVDLQNISNQPVSVRGLWLAHHEVAGDGTSKPEYTCYWQAHYSDDLHPGQVLRVHTGKSADWKLAHTEDQEGAEFFAFAGKSSFVLNYPHGDTITLWSKDSKNEWVLEDMVSYGPELPEGAVLTRTGDKLIVGMADSMRAIRTRTVQLNPPQ